MRWDRREIKSFRLRYRVENLKNILNISSRDSIFVTLNNITPLKLKKELVNENVQITAISQKTVKLLCNNLRLKNLKNSLSGSVYAIYSSKASNLNYKTILNNKNINFQFLINNNTIFRNKETLLQESITKNLFFNYYKMEILKPLLLLEMIKKTQ